MAGLVICIIPLLISIKQILVGAVLRPRKRSEISPERRTDVVLLLISCTAVVVSLVDTEYIIRANRMITHTTEIVTGRYDAVDIGQFIPLLIGGLEMIETLKDVVLGVAETEGPRVWYAFSPSIGYWMSMFSKERNLESAGPAHADPPEYSTSGTALTVLKKTRRATITTFVLPIHFLRLVVFSTIVVVNRTPN
jgi:hypothetical protein